MWFVFGFFSLSSFAAFVLYRRLTQGWTGIPSVVHGVRYEYQIMRNSQTDREFALRIGVAAPSGYDFSLKPEKWRDRFSKWIGFSVEFQTGDQAFDRDVYIVSNDRRLYSTFTTNADLRAGILRIFKIAASRSAVLREVRCGAGRLWMHYKIKRKINHAKIPVLAERVVPALIDLSSKLGAVRSAHGRGMRDPFVIPAAVILAISTALAIHGFAHVFRIVFIPVPFTVNPEPLVVWASYGAIVVVGLLVLAIIGFLGRSARAHVVLMDILLVGTVGALLTCFVALRDLNMEWDTSVANYYEVDAVSKRVSKSRRRTSYYVTIKGWSNPNDVREIEVSSSLYNVTNAGMKMSLVQKPGYLGVPWVADMYPKTGSGVSGW